MKTKVYAGFPGVGKSHFFREVDRSVIPKVSDSDSSQFSWVVDNRGEKVRNPDFPENYVAHIKGLIEKEYDIIFVSTHKEVLDALSAEGIEFSIVMPSRTLKSAYIGRYEERNSPEGFINLMDARWEEFQNDLEARKEPKIVLHSPDAYISTELMM